MTAVTDSLSVLVPLQKPIRAITYNSSWNTKLHYYIQSSMA